MRSFLFLALILPVFAAAQINRSAREFASERIQEYVTTKLFTDLPYKPVSFGELKTHEEKDLNVVWTIEHRFEITENQKTSDDKTTVPKLYKFLFYLDNRMKVLRAESFFSY
jgi:hypothetical protein